MAKIGIIGSGVVGQATGKGFAAKGHDVVFCDINRSVLDSLNMAGYDACVPEEFAAERGFDAFFLAIYTPTQKGRICLDHLLSGVEQLAQGPLRNNGKYCIVVTRCTLPPGTTENVIVPVLEEYSGKKAGRDFGVCFNPEYLRENRNEHDFLNPWIVTIGSIDQRSEDLLTVIYGDIACPIATLSVAEAEAQKYVHNIFNACKISFFNEMRMALEGLGMDVDAVFRVVAQSAEASWNPDYGIRNAGAFGGACLPKDTLAFLDWAEQNMKTDMPLLKAAIEVNKTMISRNGGFAHLAEKEKVY